MSNEELAVSAQTGNAEAIAQLWSQVRRFIIVRASAFIRDYGTGGSCCGNTAEDLLQIGFLAMLQAVTAFDQASGYKYLTYLSYALRNAWADACSYRGGRAKRPLDHCSSLDAPLTDDDDSGTLTDVVEDPSAMAELESVEDQMQAEQLHRLLEQALESLPPEQAQVLRERYYDQQTLRAIAETRGCTIHRIRDKEQQGISAIRRNGPVKRRLQAAYMETEVDSLTNFYRTGGNLWFTDQERIVEVLAERRNKIMHRLRQQ